MTKYDLIIDDKNKNLFTPTYDINYYNVRNNAWEFLIKNNVTTYPLDLRKIAYKNNWQIWSYKRYCNFYNLDIKELIANHPNGFTRFQNNSYLICYNENNSKQRNRFTICHEFGHIILQHFYKGEKLEKEANMFASRILMPMLLIKELDIYTSEELSKLCDVSIEAATYRLKRFNEIKGRERFYTNPLEQELYKQLKPFIKQYKK